MFGIVFRGHPDLKRILLPDEWQGLSAAQGLRHSASRTKPGFAKIWALRAGSRLNRLSDTLSDDTHTERKNVAGRGRTHHQHGAAASVHARRVAREAEAGRRARSGSECVIGYLHRGVEKIAENRTYQQFAPYVDRMDYVAAVSNGLGYCEAVEKLLLVEAPPRARVIRTILTELQRIASHLLWLGTHALDIGALTPLFYCLREREEILKIFEKYCGARLTTHAFRIGGLQYEAYDTFEKDVERFCNDFPRASEGIRNLLTGNRIWIGRTKECWHAYGGRRHRVGRHRPGAARQRREMGHSQGHALCGIRSIQI